MPNRHPVPTLWLMTDERMGDSLWPAIQGLPRGAGIIFRHHATHRAERRALFQRISRIAKRKHLVLVRAGAERLGRSEAGIHGKGGRTGPGLHTAPVHSRAEAIAAKRSGADLILVSPVYPTRSHPGAPALGPLRAAAIAHGLGMTAIALGGMNRRRYAQLRSLGFHGWAAIDAWLPAQKRKAVPT